MKQTVLKRYCIAELKSIWKLTTAIQKLHTFIFFFPESKNRRMNNTDDTSVGEEESEAGGQRYDDSGVDDDNNNNPNNHTGPNALATIVQIVKPGFQNVMRVVHVVRDKVNGVLIVEPFFLQCYERSQWLPFDVLACGGIMLFWMWLLGFTAAAVCNALGMLLPIYFGVQILSQSTQTATTGPLQELEFWYKYYVIFVLVTCVVEPVLERTMGDPLSSWYYLVKFLVLFLGHHPTLRAAGAAFDIMAHGYRKASAFIVTQMEWLAELANVQPPIPSVITAPTTPLPNEISGQETTSQEQTMGPSLRTRRGRIL